MPCFRFGAPEQAFLLVIPINIQNSTNHEQYAYKHKFYDIWNQYAKFYEIRTIFPRDMTLVMLGCLYRRAHICDLFPICQKA